MSYLWNSADSRDNQATFMTKPPPYVMDSNGRMVYTPSGDNEPTLTPGAYLAKQRGCTCSRLDNEWGWGRKIEYEFEGIPGFIDTEFLIQPGCPLHDNRVESAVNYQDQRPGDHLPSQSELDLPDAVDNRGEGQSLELDRGPGGCGS